MYQIGQILFVVFTKKSHVYPMRVIEVITKKSLKGEEVRYLLQAGSDGTSTVMLDQIEGEIFKSADEAKSTLTKRATTQVARLVDAAVAKSKEWYGVSKKKENESFEDLDETETETESEPVTSSVMLPDGTVANVKLPTAL